MNRDIILSLKQKILNSLENTSNASYWHNKNHFDAYLNAFILLSIKLNYNLIDEHQIIFSAIPHQIKQPNIVNITNGLAQLGFATKQIKRGTNINKIKFPCLISQGNLMNDELRILFKENDTIISYNPCDNSYQIYEQPTINRDYQIYQFEVFDEEQFDLGQSVLRFFNRTWFMALLLRFKFVIGKLVVVSIFLHLFSLVIPFYIIYTYNRVVVSHDTTNFFLVSSAVIFLLICEQLLKYFRAGVLSWLGSRVDYIVTNEVLNKFCRLPLAVIENLSVSSQVARIRSFTSVRDFFTGPIFSTLLELPAIIIMIIMISYFHYLFTLVFVLCFAALIVCLMSFHKYLSGQINKSASYNTEKYYLTANFLNRLETIHYQGLEKFYLQKLNYLSGQSTFYNLQSEFSNSIMDNYGKMVTNFGILAILCTGIHLIWQDQITIDALLATVFLSWRIFSPIQVAASTMIRSEKIYRTVKQIDSFLDFPDESVKKGIQLKSNSIQNNIRLSNIGLFYSSNKQFVLRNFSLDIKVGQLVVITGDSGSGKSSVLKLLTGYLKPNLGKILIDQYDINQINIQSLRNQFCYIPQTDNIINGSIYENINLVNPLLTKAEINKIIDHLKLAEEFGKLAYGLNTTISADTIYSNTRKLFKYISMVRLYASPSLVKLVDGLNRESFSAQTWNVFIHDLASWRDKQTVVIISDDPQIMGLTNHVVKL